MLKIENLHNTYDGHTEVLKGINLTVNKGDVVAILGPSGHGKTTLLRCISFLEHPSKGTMTLGDITVDMQKAGRKDIRALRMDMGFVFQSYNLFRNMTVMGNVMESLVTARGIDRTEADKRAREVLSQVGMLELSHRYPDELSGGQQQRAAIARAIAPRPDIILLDEPTSALDPELKKEVLDVIRDLSGSGVTMLMVTHEMEFAREVANRIVLIEDGQIVEEGPGEQMFTNPREERTKQFFGSRDDS